MFDNLREQMDSPVYLEEEEKEEATPNLQPLEKKRHFLGLNPVQRFVLALMLFLNVLVLGTLCLLATQRISLPF